MAPTLRTHGAQISPNVVIAEDVVAPGVNDDSSSGFVLGAMWVDTAANKSYVVVDVTVAAAVWVETTAGAGGGESNTASSAGSGTSLFFQKAGVDLEFNAIKSENSLLTVALDGVTHDVELTLNESLISHDALTDFVLGEHFLQSAITEVGTVATGVWEGTIVAEAFLPDASLTAQGVLELATTAEIETGTDATRCMPIDQFVASDRNIRFINIRVVEAGTDVAVDTTVGGDFEVPFTGTILQRDADASYFCAFTDTAGITGTMVVDIHLNGTTIMTTNKLDIETTEKSTSDATTQPDLTTTAVTAGDILTIDIDAIHSGTIAKGLTVRIPIRLT